MKLSDEFKSRKFLLSIYTMHMVVALGIISGIWPTIGANLDALIGGILGVLGLYLTGNVVHRVGTAKVTAPRTDPAEA